MKTSKDFDQIFSYLLSLFPNPETELKYATPFQLLVAVVLSAQTTDKQVNKVTDVLFQKVSLPQDILAMSEEEFAKAISSVNLYKSKAKHLYQTARLLVEHTKKIKKSDLSPAEVEVLEQGCYIPESFSELVKLPGVGEKTAKVILYVLYHHQVIAVDTHVHRVANRLGMVRTELPLQTSQEIETLIPQKWKPIAHHAMILFGRYYCTAKNPKCDSCQLQKQCIYYQTLDKTPSLEKKKRNTTK